MLSNLSSNVPHNLYMTDF